MLSSGIPSIMGWLVLQNDTLQATAHLDRDEYIHRWGAIVVFVKTGGTIMATESEYTRDFSEITLQEVPLVGGKNASNGELFNVLRPLGVGVLDGFATTAQAYRRLLETQELEARLRALLTGIDVTDVTELAKRGHAARAIILTTPLPAEVCAQILAAYDRLCARLDGEPELAVRSSATAEDLPEASFAGQHETFLNVRGARRSVTRRSGLLRVAVHRPCHRLSPGAWLRPLSGGALSRRAADGPLG
jgi:hypothetical protein